MFEAMRGLDYQQSSAFSYVCPEQRVPATHPLRPIRKLIDAALANLSAVFDQIYSRTGRPSIAPEKLLRALLLQLLYTVRSERMLMEQLQYNLLFRWFVGMDMDEEVWVPTVYSKNRDRLLAGDIAQALFREVLDQARAEGLLSDEHFSVDGTLIEAWASQKSFRRKDASGAVAKDNDDDPGNPSVDFHGEIRRNDSHESSTDAEARLARKSGGHEAKLAYCGNVLMENRNGLVVNTHVMLCSGTAEREAAKMMIGSLGGSAPVTVGADKGYDTQDFVKDLREMNARPHVAQNLKRRGGSAIDGRTVRHVGYKISQIKRKRIEEVFGWLKTVALLRKTRHRGLLRVGWVFNFAATAYNLVRMRNLLTSAVLAE
jgi:transposase